MVVDSKFDVLIHEPHVRDAGHLELQHVVTGDLERGLVDPERQAHVPFGKDLLEGARLPWLSPLADGDRPDQAHVEAFSMQALMASNQVL